MNMRHMHCAPLRISIFIISLFISTLGIVLITRAELGTSPISAVPFVLSLYLPWTFGQLTMAMNVVFVLGQVFLLGRDFPKVQWLQLVVALIFSASIDGWMHILSFVQDLSLITSLIVLVLGCMTLAFGICIEVASQVLLVSGDGIVKAIAHVLHWRMGSTKVCFDCCLALTGLILSTIYGGFGVITGLGIGTVISAVLVGRFVNLFNNQLFFIERLARLSLYDGKKKEAAQAASVQETK